MGLFDSLKNIANAVNGLGNKANNLTSKANNVGNKASNIASQFGAAAKKASLKSETFTFNKLPTSVEELMSLPEAALSTPFMTAALTVAVLANYENDKQATFAMLDVLHGPSPLTPSTKQFLLDRLGGKMYVVRSYFGGTSPANDYTPAEPFTVTVKDNPYSYDNEGYVKLFMHSSGADSDREIVLRRKGEQWMLWDEKFLLGDIRIPKSADPWA